MVLTAGLIIIVMVRAKLRVMLSLPANVKKHPLPFAVHRLARPELHKCYVQSLAEKLTDWHLRILQESVGIAYTPVLLVLLRRPLVEESALVLSGLRRMLMC